MNTMTYQRSRGLAALAIIAIVCLCVVACGSSGSSSSTSSSTSSSSAAASAGRTANRAKLVACLKQHGVTLPSRPAGSRPSGGGGGYGGAGGFGGGGGAPGGGGAGGRFSDPKFRAAFQACGGTAGLGGRGNVRPTSAAITRFASCVKQHGYTLPNPNLTGKGPVYPLTIEHNAKFQTASRACESLLRPAGAGAGSGSGT